MESKIALTTPSTSRCVRSGKSAHNCCTSSERIIGVPASGIWTGPETPPRAACKSGCQEKLPHASRKRKAASRLETPPFQLLFLLCRLLAGFGLFLERRAEDIAERRAGVRRAILSDGLLLLGDLHRL